MQQVLAAAAFFIILLLYCNTWLTVTFSFVEKILKNGINRQVFFRDSTRTMAPNISVQDRARITAYWEGGFSLREIIARVPCSIRTVKFWIKTSQENGLPAVISKGEAGRQRKTTLDEDDELVRRIVENPLTVPREVVQDMRLQISVKTARLRLRDAGLRSCRPARKIALGPFTRSVLRAARKIT